MPSNSEYLGLASGTVRVVAYHEGWIDLYESEAERLREVLRAKGLAVAFQHTGSTAVPGLVAKPIIDILAGWNDDADRSRIILAIEEAGYVYRGEQGIPGRDFFRRGDPRAYHLHLVQAGGPFWADHLLFRDVLRTNQSISRAYAALKLSLAAKFPTDRERYIEGKSTFVTGVLETARATQLRSP